MVKPYSAPGDEEIYSERINLRLLGFSTRPVAPKVEDKGSKIITYLKRQISSCRFPVS